jgi:hypothetical protein
VPPVRSGRLSYAVVASLLRETALPGACFALLVAAALVLPLRPHGDAGEYLLMLESWHRHNSPEWRAGDVESLRGLLAREGLAIDESRVLPNYHAAESGKLYCYHFWAFPLAGLPARGLLSLLGLSPLRALPLTNAVAFGLALAGCGWLPWSPARRRWLLGLLLLSPALAFLMWPHPEVFSFAFVSLALALTARGCLAAGVLAAAFASLQNPPLVLLVVGLVAAALAAASRGRRPRAAVLAAVAALPAVAAPLFFEVNFGVWNLSVRPSEAAESLSASRGLDLALDPNLGLLPHAPVTLAIAFAVALATLARRRLEPALLVLLLAPLLAIACTANSNWNNDTAGPSRYVVWIFPLLAFVVAGGASSPERPLARAAGWALALALFTQAVPLLARGGPLAPSDFLRHSWAARLALDHWPRLYNPAPEVFVERTLGHEGPFEGPVVYRDEAGRCRKAWLQPRHAQKLVELCGEPPSAGLARLRELGGERDTKRDWTYLDY